MQSLNPDLSRSPKGVPQDSGHPEIFFFDFFWTLATVLDLTGEEEEDGRKEGREGGGRKRG